MSTEKTTKTIERIHKPDWKGGQMTAAALAVVEKNWKADSTSTARLEVLKLLMEGRIAPDDVRIADRLIVKDTQQTGLELRLSRTGARSWALSRRLDGRQRRFTIPNSSTMSLAEARLEARQLKAQTDKGIDPIEVKRAARAEAEAVAKAAAVEVVEAPTPTLAQVLEHFGRTRAQGQRSWPVRRETIASEYRQHLEQPLASLTEAKIRRVLDAADQRGARVQGWHAHRYLKQTLAWAKRRGLIASDPMDGITAEDVRDLVHPPQRRDRVLTADELRKVWLALEELPGSPYSAIYQLILATGQRPGEVSGMLWADVDLTNQMWQQRVTKSGRPHSVPLSDLAVAILRRQRPGPGEPVPLFPPTRVFSSSAGGPLDQRSGNWNRFTQQIMQMSGTSGWHRHDLRRTAATLMAEAQVPISILELVLNHSEARGKGSAIGAVYNRFGYHEQKRAAVDALASRLEAIAAGALTPDDVEARPTRAG